MVRKKSLRFHDQTKVQQNYFNYYYLFIYVTGMYFRIEHVCFTLCLFKNTYVFMLGQIHLVSVFKSVL